MPKVLITGATGFIGANLVHRLVKRNWQVNVFARPTSNMWRLKPVLKKIKIYTPDLANTAAVFASMRKISPQIIYHFSAYGTYPSHKDDSLTAQTNIIGSVNIFRAAQNTPSVKIIINSGSSSEYGFKKKPMKENDKPEPNTVYAVTKLAQTFLAQHYSRSGRVPIITLRFFSVYGSYEEPGRLIPDILVSLVKEAPIRLSSPFPRRDFVYVEDILDAIDKVSGRTDLGGEVINLGSGKDYSVGDVVKLALQKTQSKVPVIWGVVQGRSFDVNNRWRADVRKAARVLNWRPKYSLAAGLGKSLRWFKANSHFYEGKRI